MHLVTLLEEMPVQETADAVEQLRSMGMRVGAVVINQARSGLLDEQLDEFDDGPPRGSADAPDHRRVWLELTPEGERAAAQVRSTRADPLQELTRQAFPDLTSAQEAVAVLDRLAAAAVGPDLDAARFCRGCDVESCLAGGQPCPSAQRCAANAAATT